MNNLASAISSGKPEPLIQRVVDKGKFNIVSENHENYDKTTRETEAQKVIASFGPDSYHLENTFSAFDKVPDEVWGEAENDTKQDYQTTFASKADSPFYAVCQGLDFVQQWCKAYKKDLAIKWLYLIISAYRRVENEIAADALKGLEGSAEEENYVVTNDILVALEPQFPFLNQGAVAFDDQYIKDPREYRTYVDDLRARVKEVVDTLEWVVQDYKTKIEQTYADATPKFEHYAGISPEEDLIKKRSKTMYMHAFDYARQGKKGVLKVGAYHYTDMKELPVNEKIAFSEPGELYDFFAKEEIAGKTEETGAGASQMKRSIAGSLNGQASEKMPVSQKNDSGYPAQLLSDIPIYDWKFLFDERADIREFVPFARIAPFLAAWDGSIVLTDHSQNVKKAIREFGEELLARDDIDAVYAAVRNFFPNEYLTREDIVRVKNYNFDGPIAFSAENVMAWMRLAAGQGKVDDLRYIHHEIFEIKQIQAAGHEDVLTEVDPPDDFEEIYNAAHSKALSVEMSFLMHAINLKKSTGYTWKHVAASDLERREDFLSYLYKSDNQKVPYSEDEEGDPIAIDMGQVQQDYGEYIDPQLSAWLTELKNSPLARQG